MSCSSFPVVRRSLFSLVNLCSAPVSGRLSMTESDTSVLKPCMVLLSVDWFASASISVSDFSANV